MANLVISSVCNLQCDYCFARDFLGEAASEDFISLPAFRSRLDFLERSEIKDVRLIGGEPGLHPRFSELLQEAERRFQNIVVFSNGVLSDSALEALEALPPERLTVMVNLSAGRAGKGLSEAEQARRAAALRRLGGRAMAAFTIASVDFDFEPLVRLIMENDCRRSVRLGLAQPVIGGQNRYLHPRQYPQVGKRIAAFAQQVAEVGLRVEFDCGFVRCMFTGDDMEILDQAGAYKEWRCNAVLDVDLTGRVSHCFPLARRFATHLEKGSYAAGLRRDFAAQTRPFRLAGVYKTCSDCEYKARQECTGGCLAATIMRFKSTVTDARDEQR